MFNKLENRQINTVTSEFNRNPSWSITMHTQKQWCKGVHAFTGKWLCHTHLINPVSVSRLTAETLIAEICVFVRAVGFDESDWKVKL